MLIFLFLILPGLICLYAMALRPLLHKIPALAKFYEEADGFWGKLWALSGNSLTILWGHIMALVGIMLRGLDLIGPLVGDPDLKAQVANTLQSNPAILGYISMAISFITIATRLRSILKAA